MKKYSLAMLIAITMAMPALAQLGRFEKEVYAGLTFGNYVGKDIDHMMIVGGFNIGVTGRFYPAKNFFVEASLDALTQGSQSEMSFSSVAVEEGYNEFDFDNDRKKQIITYNLDIPVMAGYRIKLSSRSCMKVKVGPYVSYALSGKMTEYGYVLISQSKHNSTTEYVNTKANIMDIDGFHRFEWGIAGALGVDFRRFMINISLQRSMTKQFNSDIYSQTINLSLGYRL